MILKIILNENTRVSPSFFLYSRMVHDYPPLINRKDNPGVQSSGIFFFSSEKREVIAIHCHLS